MPASAIRGARHGRADDGLQHVDRGRRAGRPDRAGRDHLRLRPGRPLRAEGRGAGSRRSPTGGRCRPTPAPTTTRRCVLDAADIAPQVTWGTSPEDGGADHRRGARSRRRAGRGASGRRCERMLEYMGLDAGQQHDRRAGRRGVHRLLHQRPHRGPARRRRRRARAARWPRACGRWSCPARAWSSSRPRRRGSTASSLEAGFEWREPGCSMCLGMNPDKLDARRALRHHLEPQFRGPPGPGRAHPPDSPAMAAAAAVTGRLADVREFGRDDGQVHHADRASRRRCRWPMSIPTRSSRRAS